VTEREDCVAFERALCLEKGSLVGTRINVNQGIALADELPLFVVDIGDDAIHLAGDRSGV